MRGGDVCTVSQHSICDCTFDLVVCYGLILEDWGGYLSMGLVMYRLLAMRRRI